MKQTTFTAEYRTLLTRYNELDNKQRTWREQQEFEAINRTLEAQEVGTVRAIVDDYEFMVGQAGNLGGCEIL
jgi:hypothetical protein